MDSNLQSLQEWHKLFQEGIISEQEYEAKKREILGLHFDSEKKEDAESNSRIKDKTPRVENTKILNIGQKKTLRRNSTYYWIYLLGLVGLFGLFGIWLLSKNHKTEPLINTTLKDSVGESQLAKVDSSIDREHDKVIPSKKNQEVELPEINIAEFTLENLTNKTGDILATETTNYSLKDSKPNKYIFVAHEVAYMKINGKFEIFERASDNYAQGKFKDSYSNKSYNLKMEGSCTEKPNAIMDGEEICDASITIESTNGQNKKTVFCIGGYNYY